jgi:RNA polymerase sigma-70 factor, ECF subfamily
MKQEDDGLLVTRTLAGDRGAFDELVLRHQNSAYATAVSLIADFDLAKDVVQDAFIEAYVRLPRLNDRDRFGGWLRGIVRNMVRRAHREARRVRALIDERQPGEDLVDPAWPPSHHASGGEDAERALSALGRLSEANREAICLHYLEDLPYAEIAALLKVSEATVLGRLQRGRQQLRKELAVAKHTMHEHRLPRDFASEVSRILERTVEESDRRQAVDALSALGADAIEPLARAVDEGREAIRRIAAEALCRISDPRALNPLLRLLHVRNPWNHPWLRNLVESGQVLAVPGVREELLAIASGEREHAERSWAIAALAHAEGDGEARECLLKVLRGGDRFSGAALVALCRLQPGLAAGYLTEVLVGANPPGLLTAAAWHAGRNGMVLPIEACRAALGSGLDWWGRLWGGRLLLLHGDEGVRVLRELMVTGTRGERETAALALAAPGETAAFEALAQALGDGSSDENWSATIARALALHYPGELVGLLAASPDLARECPRAVRALADRTPQEARALAESWYRDGTPSLRVAGIRILAQLRGAEFLPQLREVLREARPRKASDEAYRQMFRLGEAARETALSMLESPEWPERRAAVGLLREWGALQADQRERALADEHIAVRSAAS